MEKYVKVKKIGEGSFGQAVLVRNKEDGLQYVVKEISISKMQPKERQEARKEVSVLSKMRHPNIVQYVESFEENGCLYIAMEYCEGGDLYARINAQRGLAFSEGKVLDWFIQICLALKHVHDRKILHRDIKTSNIFLTKTGAIKLGDFGIARVLNNTMELARTCIGTPYYLSPEICENKPYNNKSDVWALGCVLYEVLTLKHAFEAGNMKNLVLKIIRGSYPPVPARYSYDLRSLVSQLFKRNPRDRPSINSILRKPFIHRLTERFLTPEQHEDEFSHTVLHHNRKPVRARPSSAAAAYKKPETKVRGPLKSPRDGRAKQIAGVYGQSVAAKRPTSAAARYSRYAEQQKKMHNDLDKKKQQYLEVEKKRREANDKKQKDELALRQLERAKRIQAEQIKRARDNARQMNLKRSAEMFDQKKGSDENKNPVQNNPAPAKLPRPTSAPSQPQPQKYAKYHQYLDRMHRGDGKGAADLAAPQLAQVKEAWNDRVSAQNAVMDAIGNKLEGKIAADRARVANEYLQRKQEAHINRNQGQIVVHGAGLAVQGVAGALRPYSAVPGHRGVEQHGKNKEEEEYLTRLKQIRIQNFNERRALRERIKGNPYKVVAAEEEASKIRREKMEALQLQAEERARLVRENVEMRKHELNKRPVVANNNAKHIFEEKARDRGIHPDQRPVHYNANPIGITQALHAVGMEKTGMKPSLHQKETKIEEPPANIVVKPEVRKNILKRINNKFMSNEEEKKENISDNKSNEPLARQAWGAKPQQQWAAGDIGLRLAALPLEETASQMEATNYSDVAVMNQAKKAVAKHGWNVPSDTVVNKLHQMSICDPTLSVPQDHDQDTADGPAPESNVNNNNALLTVTIPTSKPQTGPRPLPPVPARSQSPVRFTVNFEQAKRSKPPLVEKQTEDMASVPIICPANKGTVVLGDLSAATLDGTPEIVEPGPRQHPIRSKVVALAAKFDAGLARGSVEIEEEVSKDIVLPSAKVPENISEGEVFEEKKDVKRELPKIKEAQKTMEIISHPDDDDIPEIILPDGNHVTAPTQSDKTAQQAWDKDTKVKPKSPLKPESKPAPLSPKPSIQSDGTQSSLKGNSPSSPRLPAPPSSKISPTVSAEEPLFVKVATPSGVPSTLPLAGQSPVPVEKLSKTMCASANGEMFLKMTLGHFDSPNPKLLRTCSMPDLLKAIPEENENISSREVSPVRRSYDDLRVSSADSSRAASPVQPQSPTSNLLASVASSMNDTNFDDGGEMIPSSSQEDSGLLDEEDEDLASLRANLENVLLEDDESNGFSSDDERERDDKSQEDEAWESDNASSSDSDGSNDVSDTESVFSRLEAKREQLEAELGFDKFVKVYKYVQAIHEDEEEEMKQGEDKIRAILGSKHEQFYPRILQLVMADGAYCEDNNE